MDSDTYYLLGNYGPLIYESGCCQVENKIYSVCGATTGGTIQSSVFEWDCLKKSGQFLNTSLLTARRDNGCAYVNGRMYSFGGNTGSFVANVYEIT